MIAPGPSLAQLANDEYERRRATARRKVGAGSLEPHVANRLLRPWLALACRAGADRPEYDDALAELREIPASEGKQFFRREGLVRAIVADDIASLGQIRAALASARDEALARTGDGTDLERNDRARRLMTLAIAFGAPATAVPFRLPRKEAA